MSRTHRLSIGIIVSCGLAACLGALAWPLSPGEGLEAVSTDPAVVGQWTDPVPWPENAVHSILLHTGKVLWYRGDESVPTTFLWDPATGQIQSQTVGAILFCSGHSFLSDGRVLVTGGEAAKGTSTGPLHTFLFDPLTSQWTQGPDMRKGRYYPTNTALGDGRTLVFSGNDQTGATNELVEAYVVGGGSGGSDVWELLAGASKRMTYYPRMHLLPSGRILHVGPEQTTDMLDPAGQTWQVIATSRYGKRTHGTSVMLPPGHERIMILGGHDRNSTDDLATNTAEIIDLSGPAPAWSYTSPMTFRRMHVNAVILPDGKVLAAGGTSDENITPVHPAEIFDPETQTWTLVASLQTTRGYHSSAILLPDGRVLMAGANGNETAEIYSPPYLFRGARPVISSVPAGVQYGQAFTIQTPDASGVSSVVFMRPGATTHMVNMEQRYVPLAITRTLSGAIDVVAPNEPNIAPPGYYLLFLVNGNGVPSVARFVLLGGTPQGNRRPTVDAGPNQGIIQPAAASLDGTVTDDGLPSPPGAVTTLWNVDSGPGAVTFADAGDVDTTAAFSATGTYVLRLTADDGELTGSDTVMIAVNDPGASGYPAEIRVGSSADDAEEKASGSMYLTSSDLELVFDGDIQKIGMRFANVPVPQGETIVRAWLQFKADEIQSEATSLVIQGQAADDASTFTSTTANISSRARTTASVSWFPVAWTTVGQVGPDQRTPDLAAVIQEIVGRPGWSTGNALALIITGTGHRTADGYDGDPAGAPLLHLELASAPVNEGPSVNAGTAQTIRLPKSALLDGTVSDDGLPVPPGRVSTLWNKESGPGVVTFADQSAVDTTATFSEAGAYVLELSADDGELTAEATVGIIVNEAIPGLLTADIRVAAGADDAEEKASGNVSVTNTDLELVVDGQPQKVGLRFRAVPIPAGATIVEAWLQFKADEVQSGGIALTIQGQAIDDAPAFSTTKRSISSRARTTAAASWSPAAWTVVGEAGPGQRTTDLAAVLQEIVNRPGWSAGQGLVLVITGSGHRTAESYEGDSSGAPLLHVDYH